MCLAGIFFFYLVACIFKNTYGFQKVLLNINGPIPLLQDWLDFFMVDIKGHLFGQNYWFTCSEKYLPMHYYACLGLNTLHWGRPAFLYIEEKKILVFLESVLPILKVPICICIEISCLWETLNLPTCAEDSRTDRPTRPSQDSSRCPCMYLFIFCPLFM